MCAVDKVQTAGDEAFMSLFGLGDIEPIGPISRTNYPMRNRLIVIGGEHRSLVEANWGLIPFWAREKKIGRNAFNARFESLIEGKPMFRAAFAKSRCLLIGTSYIEFRAEDGKKIPYEFTVDGGKPYAYAGLKERWEGEGETIDSCTMITTTPNKLAEGYHNRMPAILDPSDYEAWLDPATEKSDLLAMLTPLDESRLSVARAS